MLTIAQPSYRTKFTNHITDDNNNRRVNQKHV